MIFFIRAPQKQDCFSEDSVSVSVSVSVSISVSFSVSISVSVCTCVCVCVRVFSYVQVLLVTTAPSRNSEQLQRCTPTLLQPTTSSATRRKSLPSPLP